MNNNKYLLSGVELDKSIKVEIVPSKSNWDPEDQYCVGVPLKVDQEKLQAFITNMNKGE